MRKKIKRIFMWRKTNFHTVHDKNRCVQGSMATNSMFYMRWWDRQPHSWMDEPQFIIMGCLLQWSWIFMRISIMFPILSLLISFLNLWFLHSLYHLCIKHMTYLLWLLCNLSLCNLYEKEDFNKIKNFNHWFYYYWHM